MFAGIIITGSVAVVVGGKPAARVGDVTDHGATLTEGCATVLVGGSPIVRVGDGFMCPSVAGAPHVRGTVVLAEATVIVGGRPAARMADPTLCRGAT